MEQTVTTSTRPFTDTVTNINEMLPDQNNIHLSPSAAKKHNKKITFKSENHHNGSPTETNLSEHQSDTPQEDARKSIGNHPNSQKRGIAALVFSLFETKVAHSQKKPSAADNRLREIIQDLRPSRPEDEDSSEQNMHATGCLKWYRPSRKFLQHAMEQPKFHYIIIVLIVLDLIIVFVDLIIGQLSLACLSDAEMEQYNTTIQRANCLLPVSAQTENTETALYYVSLVLISIFVLEIFTAFYAFGWRRYTKFLFALDAFIVISSFIMEVYFHFGSLSKVQGASAGIVVLRLWKIIRAIHAVAHAVTLRNHLIVEEIEHARQIVNEEKVKAEQIIEEQQKKIDSLMELLGKSNKQGSPEQQNDGSVRKRSNTMDVIIRL